MSLADKIRAAASASAAHMPDALDHAREHFGDVLEDVPDEIRQAVIDTWLRQAEILTLVASGEDMAEEQLAIAAQIQTIASAGTTDLAARWSAATETFAAGLGKAVMAFAKGALGAIIP